MLDFRALIFGHHGCGNRTSITRSAKVASSMSDGKVEV